MILGGLVWSALSGCAALRPLPVDHPLARAPSLEVRVVSSQGCPIVYWIGGPPEAPAVALLHGAMLDGRVWNHQLEALSERWRVVVWDSPGHGASRPLCADTIDGLAASVWHVLDHAGLERATLVGHSMGGLIAQHAALAAPERVDGLVMVSTSPVTIPRRPAELRALRALSGVLAIWPWRGFRKLTARSSVRDPHGRDYVWSTSHGWTQVSFSALWRVLSGAFSEEGTPDDLSEVCHLLIVGDQDRAGTVRRDMLAWPEHQPRASLVVLPGAEHLPMVDAPGPFLDALAAFLGEGCPPEG